KNNGLVFLLGLLGQQNSLDVGKDSTLSDCYFSKQLVQLLVVSNSQLKVPWDDSGLLVVASGVTGQLKNFGAQVFEHSSKVDWCSSADTLRVVTVAQKSVHTTNWELKTSS
uniref:Uncharacterized protein n=1 Tax=Ciona savignyi TaxID=51511 RepID=H2Y966_CIOSA